MFCKACRPKVQAILKKIDSFLIEKIGLVVDVTEDIKKWIDNPVLDIVTDIIPGTVDDTIHELMKAGINFALDQLHKIEHESEADNFEARIKNYVNFLTGLPEEMRNAYHHKFASLIVSFLDEFKKKGHEYDLAVQAYYSINKSK